MTSIENIMEEVTITSITSLILTVPGSLGQYLI